jgi:hypothetical protein
MTSLAYIPTPAAAVDTPAVDTAAVPTRHERPALTESSWHPGRQTDQRHRRVRSHPATLVERESTCPELSLMRCSILLRTDFFPLPPEVFGGRPAINRYKSLIVRTKGRP